MRRNRAKLLGEPGQDDPKPVEHFGPGKAGSVVLTCEHGGRLIPKALQDLAPGERDMGRHIAFDVGARELALVLSERLMAPLVVQRYSRLVIDCNRPRHAPDLAPGISDGTRVPFNDELSEEALEARWRTIHKPFHETVAQQFDHGTIANTKPALIAVHSFTPNLNGYERPWHIGLLARADMSLSEAIHSRLCHYAPEAVFAFNEPYCIQDDSDYTIPTHGEARGLPHVLIEVRSDLLGDAAGVSRWADLLEQAISGALDEIMPVESGNLMGGKGR